MDVPINDQLVLKVPQGPEGHVQRRGRGCSPRAGGFQGLMPLRRASLSQVGQCRCHDDFLI